MVGLAALLAADGPLSHGWSATWYGLSNGERVEIARTTEHRVVFPNAHRPLARYVQGWPFDRYPVPEALPAVDVTLRARVEIPPDAPLHLGADALATADIWVDGRRLAATDWVEPGGHDLWVHWRGRPAPHPARGRRDSSTVRFELRWGRGDAPVDAVPASALTPAEGPWSGARPWLFGLGLPLLFLFALGAFLAFGAATARLRARRLHVIVAAGLALLALGYRALDYDVMPEYAENADELFATWNGWSLLEDGTTRGWSGWAGAYSGMVDVERVRAFGEVRDVISPYFEHPPLMHVLVGAAAHLGGADHWLEAKLCHTRWVPILLMTLSTLLIVLIGRRLYPRGSAPYFAGLLFATIPSIVLQTRVIKEESLLCPLLLGMIWFFLRWRDDGRRSRDLILAAVCAGAGTLTKVPAIVWVPAVAMLVAAERRGTRAALVALVIATGVASLLLVYGALIDWDVFVFTSARQGTRPTHWNLFPRWFDATLVNHNYIGRGWILFLWLGFAASIFKKGLRETAPITVPLVAYMCAIAIGAGNWTFGWYIVPLYPLLCIGAGGFLARLWDEPDLLSGTIFVVLLVMYTLNFTLDPDYARQPGSWPAIRTMVTLTLVAFLTPYGIVQVWRKSEIARLLARTATVVGLMVFLGASAFMVASYDVIYDSHFQLDSDEYFTR